VKSPIWVSPL